MPAVLVLGFLYLWIELMMIKRAKKKKKKKKEEKGEKEEKEEEDEEKEENKEEEEEKLVRVVVVKVRFCIRSVLTIALLLFSHLILKSLERSFIIIKLLSSFLR
ncbi:putative F-box protein At1g47300 isoform X1 [Camelus ferus]|uniref:F-box protein At1g47300 isoform X1 n=1 Tax=Camelus ferus TaxID=419612 RepID=A0A8B8TYG0_CAMFR|nr:putative F-box protein At1g47300 isoform X1 [Camelus ferus]